MALLRLSTLAPAMASLISSPPSRTPDSRVPGPRTQGLPLGTSLGTSLGDVLGPETANVAHRGASAYAPENTLAAITEGVARGADLVEVDVQRTRDGALVLVHDTSFARTTDVARIFPGREGRAISEFTLAEVRSLDAGTWKSPSYAGEGVPTLPEALELLSDHGAGLLLEVKCPERYPGIEVDLARALQEVPDYVDTAAGSGRLVVQSFDAGSMHRLHRLLPEVPVGVLGTPARKQLPALAAWASQVNPHHRTVDTGYVAAVHGAGMGCQVWTVNRVSDMRRALSLGVDGVITNRPDVLSLVLRHELLPAA